jgi:magnesium chelatase family protein
MNPCPCGYLGDATQTCRCTPARIERYRQRISGPLLDRIDIRIEVPRIPGAQFTALLNTAPSADEDASLQVHEARQRRVQRSGCLAARLSAAQLQCCCALPSASVRLLERSAEQLALSGRGIHRLLALGRTIADLDGSETIEAPHLAEAMQLRRPLASVR